MWESTNIVIGTVTGSVSSAASLGGRPCGAVEKASRMSPLECSPAPPVRAMPSDARWASRRHWCGSSGASVATITMIEPAPAAVSGRSSYGSGTTSWPITRPDRSARDGEPLAPAVVGLHEHADRVAAVLGADHARRAADPALEAVADHPRAAADRALLDLAAARAGDRLLDVLRSHVPAVDVVEHPVPRLADDRQRPGEHVVRRAPPPSARPAHRARRRRCGCW